MKISHETPRCLLKASTKFNCYSYALVHLFETDSTYYQFFEDELKSGREVILDNSIFELGKAFDHDKFAYYVNKLGKINPDNFYYIIPDSLEEKQETIESCKTWQTKYTDLPGRSIGVVQGKSLEELLECFIFMNQSCDKVAISFDYSYYELRFPDSLNKYEAWMLGRQEFMQYLSNEDLFDKPIHLLGCGLPIEFKYYANSEFNIVDTIDTSNPIVHAIKGIRYDENNGLKNKESMKLVDLFDTKEKDIDMELLNHNIKVFRSFTEYNQKGVE